jgi:hypothetical protein
MRTFRWGTDFGRGDKPSAISGLGIVQSGIKDAGDQGAFLSNLGERAPDS